MNSFVSRYYTAIFCILMILLVGASFYLGTLQKQAKNVQNGVILACSDQVLSSLKIPLTSIAAEQTTAKETQVTAKTGQYMGSKNGTKYYAPGCSGASRIKPENVIWFTNEEDATLQGYTPAKC